MQNRFNNDFEHFVKQNADQYRMFPSDKVWKGIHNTLHTRRRWYGIGLALLLLTTGVVTWVMLTPSGKNRQIANTLPNTSVQIPAVVSTNKPVAKAVIAPAKPTAHNRANSFTISADDLKENLFTNNTTPDNTAIAIAEETDNTIITEPQPVVYTEPAPVNKVDINHRPERTIKTTPAATRQVAYSKVPVSKTPTQVNNVANYSFATAPVVTENANKEVSAPAADKKEEKTLLKPDMYPYTIESVINSYMHISKRKRVSLQAYITPTISYRELKENKPYIDYARNVSVGNPNSPYYTVDINSVVTHKPDLGLQLGFSAGYPLSKKLKLIGGLQFNVSKYDIKAYTHTTEVATITLNTGSGTSSVSTMTKYRNVGGPGANWLHNLYISASAPIGLELKLAGNRKAYIGVAGTLQPTYVISNRAYLISSDYKNYAEVPSLTRKWNMNTGFEMFAGSSTGKIKWRVGPQVRYQAMSSFDSKYPIQEHLFDFGLKLGIMLNK